MNYKEKYENLIEQLKKAKEERGGYTFSSVIDKIIPELCESEDEKIRKSLIKSFENQHSCNFPTVDGFTREQIIAWLEKQGEQNPSNEVGNYDHKKVLQTIINEQNPINKIEPKFKVGDKVNRNDREDEEYNILTITSVNIDEHCYTCHQCSVIDFEEQDLWHIVEKNSTDKVDPKFKVGDWVIVQDKTLCQIEKVTELPHNHYQYWTTDEHWFGDGTEARLWTIQDAKNGDILAAYECYVIFKEIDDLNIKCYCTYHCMNNPMFFINTLQNKTAFHPATKEQCDLLFQKMKEAGYEWDAEKKELTKINKQICYHNDGLYYAIDILEKTLGKVEGYQSDDGILEHKCAISAVKKLAEQKSAWSEEDEKRLLRIHQFIWANRKGDTDEIYQQEQDADWLMTLKPQPKQEWSEEDEYLYTWCIAGIQTRYNDGLFTKSEYNRTKLWLKSLKDRIQPQPQLQQDWTEESEAILNNIITAFKRIGKNCEHYISPDTAKVFEKTLKSLKNRIALQHKSEWSEEDEKMYQSIIDDTVQENQLDGNQIDWIKSLKPQKHWKPSEEQLEELEFVTRGNSYPHLTSLYQDLKNFES